MQSQPSDQCPSAPAAPAVPASIAGGREEVREGEREREMKGEIGSEERARGKAGRHRMTERGDR